MKRNSRMKSRIVRFGYEHRSIEKELEKVRKSADEVNKILDHMTKNPEKQGETEKNEKK